MPVFRKTFFKKQKIITQKERKADFHFPEEMTVNQTDQIVQPGKENASTNVMAVARQLKNQKNS